MQEIKRLVLSVRVDSHVGGEKLARELGLVFGNGDNVERSGASDYLLKPREFCSL